MRTLMLVVVVIRRGRGELSPDKSRSGSRMDFISGNLGRKGQIIQGRCIEDYILYVLMIMQIILSNCVSG